MAADVLRSLQLPESLDFAQPPNLTFEPGEPRPPSQASIESVDSIVLHTGLQEELKDVWPLKCVYPVLEILSTEESYVHALEQMLKVGNVCVHVRMHMFLHSVFPRITGG